MKEERGQNLLEERLNRRCPFCDSERALNGILPPDRLAPEGPDVQLIVCSGCGTLESVSQSGEHRIGDETAGYLPHELPTGLKGWLVSKSQDSKASRVLPWAGEEGLVDLGCGSGGFMAAWLRTRPEDRVVGLESSRTAVDHAKERGLEVVETDLSAPLPDVARGHTLYTLWHVLEHLDDPVTILISIREVMAPDGRIVLVVPNATGLERSLFGGRTIAWDPPRHRWHFTPEGLTALTARTGLRVLDRFNLVSDDLYDAVASLQWVLYPHAWVDRGSIKSWMATSLAVAGGLPTGLALATLSAWRHRASLGMVLTSKV